MFVRDFVAYEQGAPLGALPPLVRSLLPFACSSFAVSVCLSCSPFALSVPFGLPSPPAVARFGSVFFACPFLRSPASPPPFAAFVRLRPGVPLLGVFPRKGLSVWVWVVFRSLHLPGSAPTHHPDSYSRFDAEGASYSLLIACMLQLYILALISIRAFDPAAPAFQARHVGWGAPARCRSAAAAAR